jgi:RNA polymerase sigma-70 factor, ECF subfamily
MGCPVLISHEVPIRLHWSGIPGPCNQTGVSCEVPCGYEVSEAESRLKQLMLLGLGGDSAAYQSLLSELCVLLRRYYRRRLGSGSSESEDLVQETLIAMHERRMTFDRAQPVTAWIYAIARYKLVDHLRRKRVRTSVALDECEELFAPDDIEQAGASRDVEQLLATLPAAAGEAIRLTKLEGHSVEEAASRTGKSVSAIKVSIHRALMRLSQRRGVGLDADE